VVTHTTGIHASSAGAPDQISSGGVFGLKELQKAGDFVEWSQRAIHRCDAIRAVLTESLRRVESGECPPSADTLLLLDSISNEVCSVIDVAELCRNVHEDPAFRLAAEHAFSELSAYVVCSVVLTFFLFLFVMSVSLSLSLSLSLDLLVHVCILGHYMARV
jgi:hypothetical protein